MMFYLFLIITQSNDAILVLRSRSIKRWPSKFTCIWMFLWWFNAEKEGISQTFSIKSSVSRSSQSLLIWKASGMLLIIPRLPVLFLLFFLFFFSSPVFLPFPLFSLERSKRKGMKKIQPLIWIRSWDGTTLALITPRSISWYWFWSEFSLSITGPRSNQVRSVIKSIIRIYQIMM